MPPIARLAAISLDCSDSTHLADFYRSLLGLETYFESEGFVALQGGGVLLTMQQVADHQVAQWPSGGVPKQMHLELAVSDLDEAESAALAIGATKASIQPAPDTWRVLIDPAGHPFCVTTLLPPS